jgi:DHA1 family bicyclomycin/chloramphenicol resistance-like MFS transporter
MNMRAAGSPPAPVMSERRVSVIGAMLTAIGPLSMALFTPAMPQIVHAFGTTAASVSMTLSLYFAGFAFAQLFCGPLSDGFGRRPVAIAFMSIYAVASLAALVAPTIEVLIAARFVQGIGAAAGVAIARAIVRDLFTHERSARIMNLIGIILSVGPALAPTIGGLTMELAGWHAIFIEMLAAGIAIILVVKFFLRETVERDLSRISPRALARSYGLLLTSPYFMFSSLTIAGTSGAIYTLATVLPFIMMGPVGFSPAQFGVSMILQTGTYFCGSIVVRMLLPRFGAFRLVFVGILSVCVSSVLMATLTRFTSPSLATVMGPVAVYALGVAFVMPAMQTAALAPFPRIAGSASAMAGFLQMGTGLLGGSITALIPDPVVAMSTVIPCLGGMAVISWLIWRRLPEPALATAVNSVPGGPG